MKYLKATLLGSGALASLLLSSVLTGCQEEDFGYTQSEVYQSYIERIYAEEFAKAFPKVDPEHTWMCTPDTTYIEVEVPGMTRAGAALTPSITSYDSNKTTDMTYSAVTEVLDYMVETEDNYSNQKAATDFEYKAVENTSGNGYEEYTITPMFWGRKFVDHNAVGIYYYKDNETEPTDLGTFWDDNDNRHIEVYYQDGYNEPVAVTDQQITDHPDWANAVNHGAGYELYHPCSNCGNTFWVKDADGWHEPVFVNKYFNCIQVKKPQSNIWDTDNVHSYDYQLYINTTGKPWVNGEQFKLTFDYMVVRNNSDDDDQDGFNPDQKDLSLQFQSKPGSYVNGLNIDQKFNNDGRFYWQSMTITGSINGENVKTIALDLNVFSVPVNYYFKNIRWESTSNPCNMQHCNNGKVYVDHYQFPQYTLKMPVGTVWGMYLKTDLQQGQKSNHGNATWYSNSALNLPNQTSGTGKVKSAATFTYNDVTYISFEDAPTVCSGGGTGNCGTCGRGHWDHDYNDIVLTISPRPVTKTYRSISYRVMCEDLGGTFDWDFNDVVFDVLYKDGRSGNNATIEYKLQAIGGTLPIYMYYDGSSTPMTYDNKQELHEMTGQSPTNGLYVPVNVKCKDYETVNKEYLNNEKHRIVLKTVTLAKEKYGDDDNFDVRDYVHKIKIVATQKNGNTSTVTFPVYQGDATPQCFMTSTGTPWPDELQPITEKYPKFKPWVEGFNQAPNWWEEDM